ncbi:amino acid ABC transporter ATP-binding protein [Lichenicola cladoniae]|uniref:Arginine transport ATP-binding protein ArtP n=1 Tax=Lichenicola cladoniae TaxID=1484109 RepID=A0A6M8HJX2_9PROT|nr:amino acid ABC transporter ATP-binding protein [Lichenicola cladoniae]NPD65254.1 amino acid ABC transporter ATP-binding protein [Acetobacteraceae bacterium]QKE88846.1 amino acid ABC transporter ATP-binding protein [Lichenicola cladoniae]
MTVPVVRLDGICKSYGADPVLQDIRLDVFAGDVIGIIGPSGAGKSTMLRVINQLEPHQAGTLLIDGQPVTSTMPTRALAAVRARVGMVFQGFHLWQHMTALQNVVEGPIRVRRQSPAQAHELGLRLLAQVGLSSHADKFPSQLSGGQQQRVAIARALAMEPLVVLFDEPTSALDPGLAAEVLATIADLAKQQVTMLVVTHEMSFARRVANRIVYMQQGRILEQQPTDMFFNEASHPDIRAFLSHSHYA